MRAGIRDARQADVDSAFRRIPLRPEDHAHAYSTFLQNGVAMAVMHFAVFFGATSSVHNWARLGALLAALLRPGRAPIAC